jgi:AcrR family transcriptional regulator
MKSIEKKRTYQMSERAKQVARNDQRIMDALAELWLIHPFSEITLEKIAQKSGVTVRTILRKFGSKEGLLEASMETDAGQLTQKRTEVIPGDLPGILDALLEEYERMGDALVRTLTVEYEFQWTQDILEKARVFHREWCEMVFKPFLPSKSSGRYELILSAFITATEFYLWKLLRKDLGKTKEQTRQIFLFSLESLAENTKNQ